MEISILCIGDVVGRPGRYVISQVLPDLVRERGIDCVIANVENAAGGTGLTPTLYDKFLRYGVNVMTLGDHCFKRHEIVPTLQRSDHIIRPANLPAEAAGRGVTTFTTARGPRIEVAILMGRQHMRPIPDCPFRTINRVLDQLPPDIRIVVVEVHAELTSEKVAMGWHLDGRASVVFGTHTHIPTADECILPGGTAYITDLGMSGPYDSVLGRRKDRVIAALTTGMPHAFDVAERDPRMCGILVRINADSGHATHIERIRVDGPVAPDMNGEE